MDKLRKRIIWHEIRTILISLGVWLFLINCLNIVSLLVLCFLVFNNIHRIVGKLSLKHAMKQEQKLVNESVNTAWKEGEDAWKAMKQPSDNPYFEDSADIDQVMRHITWKGAYEQAQANDIPQEPESV